MGGEGKGSRLASGGGIPGTARREREGHRVQPRGGAHHSPSGADWCGRGLRVPEGAEGRGRDLGEEGPA